MFGTSWWFLVQAARSSYQELQLRDMLRGVEAEDVMAGDLVRIPPELSLQDAVDDYFMRYDHGAFPVEEGGRTVGLLTLRGVRRVPREQWPTRRVRDHMVPLGDQVVVAPHARMDGVLDKLQDGGRQMSSRSFRRRRCDLGCCGGLSAQMSRQRPMLVGPRRLEQLVRLGGRVEIVQ